MQQTRIGASDVQEFIVTDKSLTPVVLTMWDQFVNNEVSLIVDKIDSMPIILGTCLKVVSYKGISLTTKASSFFALNPDIPEAVDLANWLIEHKEEVLNLLVTNDPDLSLASSSMQPSPQTASPIAIISQPTEKLPRYWAKARVQITKLNQQFWYMACSSCHKNTVAEFNQPFQCLFCKKDVSAKPRKECAIWPMLVSFKQRNISSFV
ncbi:Replication protein A subunit [Quillaja saponaria]|uniref:Replication protein A subunit n=1 Tax=Quillaja saponaria TaxID=32244 RepID=A0AAD7KW12_QUISA|nr:Replication protein A subunit [Quillaja saponaria]